jgi:hypothetical protein
MREKVEHIIQNKDGQVGERNSYGNDPRSSKGGNWVAACDGAAFARPANVSAKAPS